MRLKLLTIVVALLAMATNATAQVTNDTIYNPKVIFSGMPQKYEIAGIKVTGVDNYEDYIQDPEDELRFPPEIFEMYSN